MYSLMPRSPFGEDRAAYPLRGAWAWEGRRATRTPGFGLAGGCTSHAKKYRMQRRSLGGKDNQSLRLVEGTNTTACPQNGSLPTRSSALPVKASNSIQKKQSRHKKKVLGVGTVTSCRGSQVLVTTECMDMTTQGLLVKETKKKKTKFIKCGGSICACLGF